MPYIRGFGFLILFIYISEGFSRVRKTQAMSTKGSLCKLLFQEKSQQKFTVQTQ